MCKVILQTTNKCIVEIIGSLPLLACESNQKRPVWQRQESTHEVGIRSSWGGFGLGMMEGNPNYNWWSLNNNNMMIRSQASIISPASSSFFDNHPHDQLHTTTTTSDSDHDTSNSNSYADGQEEFPQSWSQLLMGGMANDQEEDGNNHPIRQLQGKNMDQTNDHHQTLNPLSNLRFLSVDQAQDVNSYNQISYDDHQQQQESTLIVLDDIHTCQSNSSTTNIDNTLSYESNIMSNSSSLGMSSTNAKKSVIVSRRQQITEHGSTLSTKMQVTGADGGVYKKPRVQSSSQPPLRVRKELGDRITALHQIVSPFGKTDTASVLLEAIGYIRFLQGQIQALVSPYLDSSGISSSMIMRHHQYPISISVHGERNYAFHFDDQEDGYGDIIGGGKDLRSKGLCLVPISCIDDIESGIKGAADFWVTPAPALGGGGGSGGGGGF